MNGAYLSCNNSNILAIGLIDSAGQKNSYNSEFIKDSIEIRETLSKTLSHQETLLASTILTHPEITPSRILPKPRNLNSYILLKINRLLSSITYLF